MKVKIRLVLLFISYLSLLHSLLLVSLLPLLLLFFLLTHLPDLCEVLSGSVLEEEEVLPIGPVLLEAQDCGGADFSPEHLLLAPPARTAVSMYTYLQMVSNAKLGLVKSCEVNK